jgi:alkanesulfonate monooxygenase SsuD/methylene tetrahydromethanopterin reductase-like flavin-dependent oxidoreductase (luciferase family)
MPLPDPPPELHVGASSVALATLAGRVADGLNVAWRHPRRDEFLQAARAARSERAAGLGDLIVSVYAPWREELLDPQHPERTEMSALGVDRLVLIVRHPDPAALAEAPLRWPFTS